MAFYRKFIILIIVCSASAFSPCAQNCITCTSSYTTLSNGLVLCLPFNGGVITDQTASAFPGSSVNSPSAVTDRLGNANGAFQFNGTNSYLKYGDILDTVFAKSPNAKFTISGWAKGVAPSSPKISILVGKASGSSTTNQWKIYWDNDGKLAAAAYSSNTAADYILQKSFSNVANNTWFHFAFVFDGSLAQISRCKLYVNGVLGISQAPAGNLGNTTINTAQEITIGAGHANGAPFTANNPFNGMIDDVRIYNRPLSNTEINELYNGTPLQITKMPDVGLCIGDSVQLNAFAATTYTWFPSTYLSATNIANPICKPTANKTYYITIANGTCTNKDTVIVSVNQNCCVNSTSIESKNNNMIYFMPINSEAKDISSNPAAATVLGPGISLSTDRFGNKSSAYSFTDVTNDKIITPAVPKLSFPSTRSFTISTWVYARTLRPVDSRILSVFKNGGFDLILSSTVPADAGKIEFLDYDGGSSTTMVRLVSDSAISLGKWYHIAMSVSKDDSMNRLYINGRLAGEVKAANSVQNACGVAIGNHNLNPLGLDGMVDEVRIYNYSMSQPEIMDLYYLGKSRILNEDTTICSGDSVQINTFGNSTIYSWSPATGLSDPSIANPVARPMATTTYVLTSTNGTCLFKDTVIIYVNYSQADAGIDTTICKGDSIRLQGTGGSNFLWSPGTGLSNSAIANPFAKPTTTATYVLTVTTATCQTIDTVVVNVNDVIANAGPDLNMCYGDSIQLNATGGTDFQWAPYATLTNYQIANPKAFPADTQLYRVMVTSGFCSNTDSIKVNVIHIFPDAGTNQQICPGDSIKLTASGGNQYAWVSDPGISDTTLKSPFVKPTSTRNFYVYAKISTCAVIDSVKVTVASTLTTDAGPDLDICIGQSAQLTANGGTTFQWSPVTGLSDPNIANPVATPTDTTPYVVFSSTGNCTAYDTVNVNVNPLPSVYAGTDTSACKNQPIMLTPILIPSGVLCTWMPSNVIDNPNIAYPNATINTPTEFKLVAVNPVTGCSDSDLVWVDVSTPTAKFKLNVAAGDAPFKAITINESVPQPMTYLWTFGDSTEYYSVEKNPYYTFNEPGVYYIYLAATDIYGCTDYDTATVEVRDVVRMFIPNAFTPNGDHSNEIFKPVYSANLVTKIEGTIWNKWGEIAHVISIPDGTWWDGKTNGQLCPEGVYYYQFKVTDINKNTKVYRGSVSLLR